MAQEVDQPEVAVAHRPRPRALDQLDADLLLRAAHRRLGGQLVLLRGN